MGRPRPIHSGRGVGPAGGVGSHGLWRQTHEPDMERRNSAVVLITLFSLAVGRSGRGSGNLARLLVRNWPDQNQLPNATKTALESHRMDTGNQNLAGLHPPIGIAIGLPMGSAHDRGQGDAVRLTEIGVLGELGLRRLGEDGFAVRSDVLDRPVDGK